MRKRKSGEVSSPSGAAAIKRAKTGEPTAATAAAAAVAHASVITVGYWHIRGLIHPAILALEHAKLPYNVDNYQVGPDGDRSCWFIVKESLNLDFPNLPYLLDKEGTLRITQSNAILRYVARVAEEQGIVGMTGADAQQAAIVDMWLDQYMDIRNMTVRLCYGTKPADWSPAFDKFKKGRDLVLSRVEQALKRNPKTDPFILGHSAGTSRPCIADFAMYEILLQQDMMDPGCLKPYPRIRALITGIEQLASLKQYFASEAFKERQGKVNNPSATWNTPSPTWTTPKCDTK